MACWACFNLWTISWREKERVYWSTCQRLMYYTESFITITYICYAAVTSTGWLDLKRHHHSSQHKGPAKTFLRIFRMKHFTQELLVCYHCSTESKLKSCKRVWFASSSDSCWERKRFRRWLQTRRNLPEKIPISQCLKRPHSILKRSILPWSVPVWTAAPLYSRTVNAAWIWLCNASWMTIVVCRLFYFTLLYKKKTKKQGGCWKSN